MRRDRNNLLSAFSKAVSYAAITLGGMLSVYFILAPMRVVIGLGALLAAIGFWLVPALRRSFAIFLRWIESHQMAVFYGLVALAVVECVALAKSLGMDISDEQISDAKRIWEGVQGFMSGTWPVSKSWTSTLFYGVAAKCMGGRLAAAVVAGIVLHFASGVLAFDTARRLGGVFAGVVASALILLNPVLVVLAFSTATENLYVFFLLLSFWLMARAEKVGDMGLFRHCLVMSLIGAALWGTVWSRGEGIVLWPVFILWIAVSACSERWSVRRVMATCLVVVGMFAAGAAVAIGVNQRTQGVATIFCSNDNMWPRLIGANVKFTGCTNREDKPLIRDMMVRDGIGINGEKTKSGRDLLDFMPASSGCPPEAVPYIEAEIARRWNGMGLCGKCRFVWRKWQLAWHGRDGSGYCRWLHPFKKRNSPPGVKMQVSVMFFPALIALGGLLYYAVAAKRRTVGRVELCLPFVLLGHFAILAVTEVSARYGLVFNVVWAFPAALALAHSCQSITRCGCAMTSDKTVGKRSEASNAMTCILKEQVNK